MSKELFPRLLYIRLSKRSSCLYFRGMYRNVKFHSDSSPKLVRANQAPGRISLWAFSRSTHPSGYAWYIPADCEWYITGGIYNRSSFS